MASHQKPKKTSLSTLLTVCRNRGFTPRRVYMYEGTVIFIDLGNLWIYIPSRMSVVAGRSVVPLLQADPVMPVDSDEGVYEQSGRIIERHGRDGPITDVNIMKGHYVYTAARKRKWKTRKYHKLGLRIAVDYPDFVSNPHVYRKANIAETHLHMILNTPVSEQLEPRKQEYEAYIDSILNEMHSISDAIQKEIKKIKKIRNDNREHLKFVSVDIQAAHAVAKHEKNIRKCSAAQLEAKNLMKEAVANISAFVLEAEAAEYILSLTSDEVAKASATISDLA
jgi:hypothetical protein